MKKTYPYLQVNPSFKYFLQQIPVGSRILEFGPALGYMTKFLKEERNCKVTCIELNPQMAEIASQYAEKMIVADIDQDAWENDLEGLYDYVIFADVLEHLRYPEYIIQKTLNYLKPDGYILTSIPNISHNAIILGLKRGKFTYTQYGLLDNTHIHLFTRASMYKLFTDHQMQCVEEKDIIKRPGATELNQCYLDQAFSSLLLFHRKDGHVYQFICKWCRSNTNPPSFKPQAYRYPLWKLPILVYFDIKDFLRIRYNIHFHLLPQKK